VQERRGHRSLVQHRGDHRHHVHRHQHHLHLPGVVRDQQHLHRQHGNQPQRRRHPQRPIRQQQVKSRRYDLHFHRGPVVLPAVQVDDPLDRA